MEENYRNKKTTISCLLRILYTYRSQSISTKFIFKRNFLLLQVRLIIFRWFKRKEHQGLISELVCKLFKYKKFNEVNNTTNS